MITAMLLHTFLPQSTVSWAGEGHGGFDPFLVPAMSKALTPTGVTRGHTEIPCRELLSAPRKRGEAQPSPLFHNLV